MNQPQPDAERRNRYAQALAEITVGHRAFITVDVQVEYKRADAAMAIADAEQAELRKRHKAGLRRADKMNNDLMEEVQRYAIGTERPVLWSVYNRMHIRAATAEAEVRRLQRLAAKPASADTSEDRCAECGHFRGAHEEAEEPVSVGRCTVCPDGDEWHDFEAPEDPSRLAAVPAAAEEQPETPAEALLETIHATATAWARPSMSEPSRIAGQHLLRILNPAEKEPS